MSKAVLRGVGAAAGVALGPAVVCRHESEAPARPAGNPDEEGARFREAVAAVDEALQRLTAGADAQAIEILEAHRILLQDPDLHQQVEAAIAGGKTAGEATEAAAEQFAAMLESLDDPYLKERAADVRDVGRRLVNALRGVNAGLQLNRPCVVVARDLAPSDTIGLDRSLLLGIVTEQGGPTSHTCILARSWGIPAVVGVPGLLAQAEHGSVIAVDGSAGEVILFPSAEVAAVYAERIRAAEARAGADRAEAELPAETPDGHRVALAANAGTPGEVGQAMALGAEGVGLLRSEFMFMGRDTAPGEEEQYRAYAGALEAAGGRRVIIRTLDIGGDKAVPYLNMEPEENPFLGCRALRLCFRRPGLFRTQLRALLRAGVHGRLAIMFPMIGTLADLRAARAALDEARRSLEAEGLPHAGEAAVEVGIMIEIPSAALVAGHLAREVDFFSIGTNDLTQYTLAVDRGNPGLAELYQPSHPAVLQLIDLVVKTAHEAGRWVGVCGELAGQLEGALLLLGLGVDELSMAPAALPEVRRLVRSAPYSRAQELAREALAAASADDVRRLL